MRRHREWDPWIIPSTDSSRFSKIGWLCPNHSLSSCDIQPRKVFSENQGGGYLNLLSFSVSIINFLCSLSDRVLIYTVGSVSGQSWGEIFSKIFQLVFYYLLQFYFTFWFKIRLVAFMVLLNANLDTSHVFFSTAI